MSYGDCCDWNKCTACGDCLVKCPVMNMDRDEAKNEINLLLKGEKAPRVFDECTLCFNCNQYCPVEGLRPHELIQQRILEGRKGNKVNGFIPYLINGLPEANLFDDLYSGLDSEEKTILDKWSQNPEPCKEMLFIGCVGRMSCFDIEHSDVLSELPKFGPRDICCGELAYRLGSWQSYAEIAERTIKRFLTLECETIVCFCGSCFNYLDNILPNVYGEKLPFKIISMYEWIWEKYKAGNLDLVNSLNYKAAVHESCYVSELGPEFASMLRELYTASGVETVELEHHGENNLSCGAVSFARNPNPLKSIFKNQHKKYREVKEAGVKDIACNCPGCTITMSATAKLYGKKTRYMPEEILRAFGDRIERPLESRNSQILLAGAKRLPTRYFRKVDNNFKSIPVDGPVTYGRKKEKSDREIKN